MNWQIRSKTAAVRGLAQDRPCPRGPTTDGASTVLASTNVLPFGPATAMSIDGSLHATGITLALGNANVASLDLVQEGWQRVYMSLGVVFRLGG